MMFNALRTLACVFLLILTLAACSGTNAPPASSAAPSPAESPDRSAQVPAASSALTVTGVEYAYEGVPQTAPAGTVVTFVNAGNEVHQIVAARRNDGVIASLDELLAMPEEESNKLVTILGMAVALPGETAPDTISLDKPGTYFFVCFIPVGVTAFPSLAPDATPTESLVPDGPPHFIQGMVAEITVTAAISNEVAPSDSPGPLSPSASPSASPGGETFESRRHGYRVDVPNGWTVNEYSGSWEALADFSPGAEIPGEDVIAPRDFSSFLVMNSMPIPSGMTGDEWHAAFKAIVAAGLPADCSTTTGSATFAGEPATVVEQRCGDVAVVGRSLVHGGRGYYFTTLSPYPDPVSAAVVEELASSIEFTE
jgi:plastocyanin